MDLEFVGISIILSAIVGIFVFSLSISEYWIATASVLAIIYGFGVWSKVLDMRYSGLELQDSTKGIK